MENKIDSLINEVMDCAEKLNNAKIENDKALQRALEITEKNMTEIFMPVFDKISNLSQVLYEKTRISLSRSFELASKYYSGTTSDRFSLEWCNTFKALGINSVCFTYFAEDDRLIKHNSKLFRDVLKFYTKEGVENTMQKINCFVVDCLTELKENCTASYEELSDSLDALKKELDTSFEVNNVTEESVEIRIGGTTYIGKVVKE